MFLRDTAFDSVEAFAYARMAREPVSLPACIRRRPRPVATRLIGRLVTETPAEALRAEQEAWAWASDDERFRGLPRPFPEPLSFARF
jgi:hypothetical protein